MPTSTRIRARNYVAMSPLLRKGGVHERSKSGVRANVKHEMLDEISHWREALEQECLSTTGHPRNNSGGEPFEVAKLINTKTILKQQEVMLQPRLTQGHAGLEPHFLVILFNINQFDSSII